MFCCMGVAISKKDKKVKPITFAKSGDKIKVWEKKKVIKNVLID